MANFEVEYARLNDQQKVAVEAIEGPILVIAGPGTGKTQLLSMRVANILHKTDTDPANILCLTFTDAAARNMRERLTKLIGEAAYRVAIYTYHGFGSEIIQRYPEYFEDSPLLHPIEELTTYEILRSIFSKLTRSNPLSTQIGDDFLHLNSVKTAISWFKQAGITLDDALKIAAENEAFVVYAQPLVAEIFAGVPSAKNIPQYKSLLAQMQAYIPSVAVPYGISTVCAAELESAIEATDSSGRYAKEITAWRNKWLTQNHFKEWGLCDAKKATTLHAIANVYKEFQQKLASQGYYTYDDMILRTTKALEQYDELRLLLQEKYQFVLVDEYQDTNGAQNRLLELLADNPVNEERPNLMVVGDDDQAIYRFQGANMSVMLDFLQRWKNVQQVVLTNNYRSHQDILNLSRLVVLQGIERLENLVPGLTKDLRAAAADITEAKVTRTRLVSELDQYAHVAQQIQQLITQGVPANEIAVLAPKHSYLQALVPHLIQAKIAVNYERREHILEQPHIEELLTFAKVIIHMAEGEWGKVEALMPKLLSAAYWEIAPSDIIDISLAAYRTKKTWYEVLTAHKKPMLRSLATALATLAKDSLHAPLEQMFDKLIGSEVVELDTNITWRSPYKNYYFNSTKLETAPEQYLTLLGQLSTLRHTLSEYQPDTRLVLIDLVRFVTLYEQSNLPLVDTNPHSIQTNAVELLTAYKAKGLEWKCVFLLGCHNDIWGIKARSSNYSFSLPTNLLWIKPARDSADDRLRLFYVALTRAKSHLYLMEFSKSKTGRSTEPVSWLLAEHPHIPALIEKNALGTQDLVTIHEVAWNQAVQQSSKLKDSLATWLQTYMFSPTHLNDFLDISKGGPRNFMLRHMLHFPERLGPSAVFGSAMHEALHYAHNITTQNSKQPTVSEIQRVFKEKLNTKSLTDDEESKLIERGTHALQLFLASDQAKFLKADKSEFDFKHEGVVMNGARLTGKIDVLRENSKQDYTIIDYKTGIPMESWKPKGGPYSQIRAHLYQQQLMFYSLLLQHAHSFRGTTVQHGIVQFVEPTQDNTFAQLELAIDSSAQERLSQLILTIWQHIMDFNFPDTSQYSLDVKGVLAFENDLLDGKI